jgi:hypothetical protein
MEMNLVYVSDVGKNVCIYQHTNGNTADMRKQTERLKNKIYSYYPSNLVIVKIDNEDVLLGPIIYELLKERGITQRHVTRETGFDFRTLRDFLHGRPSRRVRVGIAVTSQVMKTGNITVPEVVAKAREMRSMGHLPCIKPPDVADLQHDGRMDERKAHGTKD